jgi:phosphatidylglycerophosphate synthase
MRRRADLGIDSHPDDGGRGMGRGTPTTLSDTLDHLRQHQKPSRGAPAYSRFVNRPAGRLIAALSFRAGLTPNGVTAISGCLSLAAVALLALGSPSLPVALGVAALTALGYAFDSADGQLARLTGGGSVSGEWLDHVVDCAKINLLHIAAFFFIDRTDLADRWLLVPLAFLVVANLFFFSFILTDLLTRLTGARRTPAPASSVLRSFVNLPTDYGLLCVTFLLLAWPRVFAPVYGLLMLGTAGYVALGLPKWYRGLKAAGSVQG